MKDGVVMRIMFVIPNLNAGGAERVTAILANEFVKMGHEVIIELTTKASAIISYDVSREVQIERMKHFGFNNIGQWIKSVKSIRHEIVQRKPDVVVSFFNPTSVVCAVACWGLKIPVIFSERNDPRRLMVGIQMQMYQFALKRLVHYSVFQTTGAMNLYPKSFTKKSCVILNPVNTENMPQPYRGQRTKRVVAVGRLFEQKRYDVFIKAFATIAERYPEHSLEIYGKGPEEEHLRQLISSLQMEERILLKGEHRNVFDLIWDAEIFVMSSDYEGLPNALMEAMVLGIPCVSTRCSPGGAEELIDDEKNGLLVPCGQPEMLAHAIEKLLANPGFAAELGKNAEKLRARTSVRSIANQWIKYFEEVIQEYR